MEVPASDVMPFVSLRKGEGGGVAVGLVGQHRGRRRTERGTSRQERQGQGVGEFVCYIANDLHSSGDQESEVR